MIKMLSLLPKHLSHQNWLHRAKLLVIKLLLSSNNRNPQWIVKVLHQQIARHRRQLQVKVIRQKTAKVHRKKVRALLRKTVRVQATNLQQVKVLLQKVQ